MATKPVSAKPAANPGAPGSTTPMAPMGVAPRFPKVANYLKGYTLFPSDWQREQIPALARYAAGKAGSTPNPNTGHTREFHAAARHLLQCGGALQWHAIQAALSNAELKPNDKAKSVTEAATRKEFEKLVNNGKHVHMSTPPARLAQEIVFMQDKDIDPDIIPGLDSEISESEYQIVRHLLLEGHTMEAVRAALLEFGPELALRKGEGIAVYVADTLERVQKDAQLKAWLAALKKAQKDARNFAENASDWQELWRRSVAYNFLALRMLRRSGDLRYNLFEVVKTATCCLVLGWSTAALTLYGDICRRWTEQGFYDIDTAKKPFHQRRTQFFLLRLFADWQGVVALKMPPQADDEPLFAALLANWRTTDIDKLAPLLLAACDRHTHMAMIRKDSPDFGTNADLTYLPFEILAVLRLRNLHGLPNPVLDHPLMLTPLGMLPPVSEFFVDELLGGVLAQARKEMVDL